MLISKIDPIHKISVWKNSFKFDDISPSVLLSDYNVCCFMNSRHYCDRMLLYCFNEVLDHYVWKLDTTGFCWAIMTACGRFLYYLWQYHKQVFVYITVFD